MIKNTGNFCVFLQDILDSMVMTEELKAAIKKAKPADLLKIYLEIQPAVLPLLADSISDEEQAGVQDWENGDVFEITSGEELAAL